MQETREFDVRIRGRPVMSVQLHEALTGSDASPAPRPGGAHHPWEALLVQSAGSPKPGASTADADAAGDVDTQCLFDGLDELYEAYEKASEAPASTDGGAADTDVAADDLDSKEADGLDSKEADGLETKAADGLETKAADGPGTKAAGAPEGDLKELADMDDAEAKRIVGSLGGFTRPGSSSGKMAAAGRGASALLDGLPDMGDAEAQRIVQGLGGFGRPPLSVRARGQAASPRPAASPFPSKRDVLSARRALMDRGKAQAPTFSPPTRSAGAGAGARAGPLGRGALPPAPAPSPSSPAPRMLAFKQPGLRRASAQLRFSSPAKRPAADSDGDGDGDGDGARAAVRLVQFAQPFSPPGRARPGAQRPVHRARPPPVLPPVTSWPASGGARASAAAGPRAAGRPLRSLAGLLDVGAAESVPRDARAMTAAAAAEYRFAAGWGAGEARAALAAAGCDAGAAWVANHFRWVVWTSACLARRFPTRWRELWSAERVLGRLRHRYAREHEAGARSALRRILEGDAAPQQPVVLCVAAAEAEAEPGGGGGGGDAARVELTDGWYGVAAHVDAVLARAVRAGRLRAGDKIACAGLGLRGLAEPAEPLSAQARGAALVLCANSVRRARWDARLGFRRGAAPAMSLGAVHRQGGAVGATLDVVVVRRYPLRFMETAPDGRRTVRAAREEERVALAFAEARAARMADLLEGGGGDAIAAPSDDDVAAAAEAVDRALPPRQVQAMLRLLVCDYPARPYRSPAAAAVLAEVTVWRPGDVDAADLAEGSRVLIAGAAVSSYRGGAGGSSLSLSVRPTGCRLRPAPADPHVVARSHYRPRATLRVDDLRHVAPGQEVDVAGEACGVTAVAGGQTAVLRLRSTSSASTSAACVADVEFSLSVFGRIAPAAGAPVTVRNCRVAAGAADVVPRLLAGDTADFAL
ncbi:hypothetical protein H4R18_004059 [Coemansia javaensis]|uniref:BRCA2 OB1 domain-containing protein n=1 Tax=Coemansia javaensis TaxID=2761396 RepID=A0A9W8LFE1_9FUNG|nr:hypothetical protein H4R18_004059 [Coemansia javaensis]